MFAQLSQLVARKGDWGMQAEVARYRTLECRVQDYEIRIAQMQAELATFKQAKDLSQARLEAAKLDKMVSELRYVGRWERGGPGPRAQIARRGGRR